MLVALAASHLAPLAVPATLVLLCYFPGRLVVAGFELAPNWDTPGRALLAVAMSLAVTPVLLNPVWHVTNSALPLLAYLWILLTVGVFLVHAVRHDVPEPRDAVETTAEQPLFSHARSAIVAAAIALLVAFAAIVTYWPSELRGYPVPALIHDFIKHQAVMFSLQERPLPLGNPFYADEAAGPVYYYHFFYLIPATLRVLSPGVSIELAFGLQAGLVGICTAGMFYLIVKRFAGGDGPATLAALLSTAIGGLDIIPLIVLRKPVITLDAWADTLVRIHNLLTQIVWTPQNVLGLLIVLVGVYTLSVKGWWRGWFLLGPVLAAALVGSTIWVAAGVFPALALLVLLDVLRVRKDPAHALRRLLLSGVVALLMLAASLPSLLGYLEMSHRHGKSLSWQWPYQSNALLGKLAPPGVLANLLDLPWVLVLELGPLLLFPLLLPRRLWRRAWEDRGLRLLLISACVALAAFVTIRSHFTYNDFGQKVILATMAAGVVLGASILAPSYGRPSLLNPLGWKLHEDLPLRWRKAVAVCVAFVLLLGLPVGVFQTPVAAVRRYLPSSGLLGVLAAPVAQQAAAEAKAGQFLRHGLAENAVIQAHWEPDRLLLAQIACKQVGIMALDRDTMVFFPKDEQAHQRTLEEVAEVLEQAVSAERCHQVLREHRITHVFFGTLERERWHGREKFFDQRYFDCIFEADDAAVYALRQ